MCVWLRQIAKVNSLAAAKSRSLKQVIMTGSYQHRPISADCTKQHRASLHLTAASALPRQMWTRVRQPVWRSTNSSLIPTAVLFQTNNIKDNRVKWSCWLPANGDLCGWTWESKQWRSLIDGVLKINSPVWQVEDLDWISSFSQSVFLHFCKVKNIHKPTFWLVVKTISWATENNRSAV